MNKIPVKNAKLHGVYFLEVILGNNPRLVPICVHSFIGVFPVVYVNGIPIAFLDTFLLNESSVIYSPN